MSDCQLYLISPLDVGGDFPQRLERAVQAVANENRSFSTISEELGFSVPAHFSRFFHDHAGSSPRTFRAVSALRDG